MHNMFCSTIETTKILQKQGKQMAFSHTKDKTKQRRVDLLQEVEDGRIQIRRLKQTINKMSHQYKNTMLYFQTTIKQLDSVNQQYKAKIDSFENQSTRSKRSTNITQSKLNKSSYNNFIQESYKQNSQNKQNVNLLNSGQNFKCNSPLCQARIQLQEVKKTTSSIINTLSVLLYSMKTRQDSLWSTEDYQKWAQNLQMERKERRTQSNKSSLQLVKLMQQKIKKINQHLQNQSYKCELSSQMLFQSLKMLKQKQKNMMKIPFLQKIDLQQRRQDRQCFIQSAQLMKQRILQKLRI